jgi:hypothetical protein
MYTRYMRIWPFSPSEAAQGRWRHGWPECFTVVLDSQEAFDTFESCAVLFPTTIMCRIGVALEPNLNLKNQPDSYVASCFIIFLFKHLLGWVLWDIVGYCGYPHSFEFDVSWHSDFVRETFPRLQISNAHHKERMPQAVPEHLISQTSVSQPQ